MKAIIIGGTGATGKELVKQLLEDARFKEVVVLVRRPYFDEHKKLKEVIVDFENLNNHADMIQGDVAFSCLGTTLKDAGSKDAQWRVDHDYQLEFASVAKANGVKDFVLISAFGADAKSFFFYSKMKGTLEDNIRKLGFSRLIVMQPGGIDRPGTTRKGEAFGMRFLKVLNTIGLFKGYAPLPTRDLAQAMIEALFKYESAFKKVSVKEITALI